MWRDLSFLWSRGSWTPNIDLTILGDFYNKLDIFNVKQSLANKG